MSSFEVNFYIKIKCQCDNLDEFNISIKQHIAMRNRRDSARNPYQPKKMV